MCENYKSLWRELGLTMETSKILAAAGGGGKTSLLFALAGEAVKAGKKVLVTTTTHMAYEPSRPFVPGGDPAALEECWKRFGYAVAGHREAGKEKIRGLTQEECRKACQAADVVLVEADGSRGYPLKVPAGHEPVIPEEADTVVGVLGLDALGRKISQCCHRPQDVGAFLNKSCSAVVDEEDLVKIAGSCEGLRKMVGKRKFVVVFNKVDVVKDDRASVKVLVTRLEEQGIACRALSLREFLSEGYESVD